VRKGLKIDLLSLLSSKRLLKHQQPNSLEKVSLINLNENCAGVAQLVEHHLAKVDVEGSNPFARSIQTKSFATSGRHAIMFE
jgi:hypothetical protein